VLDCREAQDAQIVPDWYEYHGGPGGGQTITAQVGSSSVIALMLAGIIGLLLMTKLRMK
jgi:hypothetical protein